MVEVQHWKMKSCSALNFRNDQAPLLDFLEMIGQEWNISLFHYRNHGAAYGRVLAGIQVPAENRKRFDQFLAKLGYSCWEETGNPVYKLFLGD